MGARGGGFIRTPWSAHAWCEGGSEAGFPGQDPIAPGSSPGAKPGEHRRRSRMGLSGHPAPPGHRQPLSNGGGDGFGPILLGDSRLIRIGTKEGPGD